MFTLLQYILFVHGLNLRMKRFDIMKRYIGESYFNPILHIIPILSFLMTQDFYGTAKAWLVSLILTILVGFHVFQNYQAIFRWYLVSVNVYLLVALSASYLSTIDIPIPFKIITGEIVAMVFMLSLIIYKKYVYRFIVTISNKQISMENNLNELISITKLLSIIFAILSVAYVSVYYLSGSNRDIALTYVYRPYTATIIIIGVFRTVRILFIRTQLLKEQWLPIVNENGQEVGSINYNVSINDRRQKYTHPVARVIIIEGNRILLRKRLCTDDISPNLWDNAVCNHVRLKESVSDCINRSTEQIFGTTSLETTFLSNYLIENNHEKQYVHMHLSSPPTGEVLKAKNKCIIKWWTIPQIEAELDSGIFTDNFLKEYELLKQIGLVYNGKCECECKLRDVVQKKNKKSDKSVSDRIEFQDFQI